MAKILLVEDDELIARVIMLRLEMCDHELDHAINGREAIDKALTGNYELVLMDMHMPLMDGYEATRVLRTRGYEGVIIAVTASALDEDCDKAISSGCNGFISKPIGQEFEKQVSACLP
ncbi:response regulator [Motiliproteus sp. MSK22-1]|uniref:response regulator n=1 Tax=Motiliproteus sp. MSK22-1 TaxID=1897630 RepID=UPI0009771CA5|nr:response regulator [Motiliproteus sp. MSK22-1]OMH32872.1 hypothetical protein BGP75_14835 [Motiliproteus sp. MSK22-1]